MTEVFQNFKERRPFKNLQVDPIFNGQSGPFEPIRFFRTTIIIKISGCSHDWSPLPMIMEVAQG
jgi:hypothetical protein